MHRGTLRGDGRFEFPRWFQEVRWWGIHMYELLQQVMKDWVERMLLCRDRSWGVKCAALVGKITKKKWIHLLYVVFLFLFFWNAIIASCSVEAWKLCNLTDADWFCQHLWTNIPLCGTTDFRTETSQKLTLVIKCISCKGIRTYFLQ